MTRPRSLTLRQAAEGVLLFLCLFLPFRTPLSHLLGDWVRVVPDCLIVLLVLWQALQVFQGKMRLRLVWADGVLLLFLLLALVSTCLINHQRLFLYVHQARSLCLYYLFAIVLRQQQLGKETLWKMTGALQLASWPLCVLGFIERLCSKTVLFDADFARSIYSFDNMGRVYGMFYNPNIYGLFLLSVLLLSLSMHLLYGKKTKLPLYIQLCVMLWLTMSRSGLLALAAVAVLAILIFHRQLLRLLKMLWWRVLLCAGVTAVVAFALPKAAEAYYFARVQPMLEGDNLRTISMDVKEVTFTLDGETYLGWRFNGITYVDARCAVPLREEGAIIHLETGDMTLPVENNDLRETYIYSNAILKSFHVSSATRMNALSQSRTYQVSVNGRLFSVLKALEVARDHPLLGTGFGTFGSAASLTYTPDSYASYGLPSGFYSDCQYSSVLGEMGFLGLTVFLAFLLAVLLRCRKHSLLLFLCLFMGWYGLFFNMLEVHIAALLLWSLPELAQQQSLSLSDLQEKMEEIL